MAVWVGDLERSRLFYEKYFNARTGVKYENAGKRFTSYFLTFAGGTRLELMHSESMTKSKPSGLLTSGWAHMAFSVGGREEVITLTELIRNDGYKIYSEPRETGDGYFESVILDPDGNMIEITI